MSLPTLNFFTGFYTPLQLPFFLYSRPQLFKGLSILVSTSSLPIYFSVLRNLASVLPSALPWNCSGQEYQTLFCSSCSGPHYFLLSWALMVSGTADSCVSLYFSGLCSNPFSSAYHSHIVVPYDFPKSTLALSTLEVKGSLKDFNLTVSVPHLKFFSSFLRLEYKAIKKPTTCFLFPLKPLCCLLFEGSYTASCF